MSIILSPNNITHAFPPQHYFNLCTSVEDKGVHILKGCIVQLKAVCHTEI